MLHTKQLNRFLTQPSEELCRGLGIPMVKKGGKRYWFKDNGSSILAVAHLDSVQPSGWVKRLVHPKEGTLLFAPTLDDRLGAYIIGSLLPHMGVKMDILFCDEEEHGRSTASLFESKKQYNWMVEFDRAGEDVVTYDYYDYKKGGWNDILKEYFKDVNRGSYSDIEELEFLECKGFNIGIGYENYHGPMAFAKLDVTDRQINRFLKFYREQKNERYPHTQAPVVRSYHYGGNGGYTEYEYGRSVRGQSAHIGTTTGASSTAKTAEKGAEASEKGITVVDKDSQWWENHAKRMREAGYEWVEDESGNGRWESKGQSRLVGSSEFP